MPIPTTRLDGHLADALRAADAGEEVLLEVANAPRVRAVYAELEPHLPSTVRVTNGSASTHVGFAAGGLIHIQPRGHAYPIGRQALVIRLDDDKLLVDGVLNAGALHARTADWGTAPADRRVRVDLALADLERLLGLPANARVVSAHVEHDPFAVAVIVEHPDAEPVPPGAAAPRAHLQSEAVTFHGIQHRVEVAP
ncbi:hypothetical protein [Aeromicrobium sp. Leaf291]|uniref:hypothetical protein n=1 Tax=Aeromicrobium sp. Leaf291 TaxID=1736325 RepID=UPI0006F4F5D7|nr:hypothetical protein [Aeromicrobium sp. Leaf291]KQP81612.1 hypothetical protein ASF35_16405 [Aeromicrobium sp. Leaf291]